ncbi:MAG: hypothetical protein ACJ0DK_00415 [Planctomycetota bacterium]
MVSLGCPKNLVDSEVILGRLGAEGFVVSQQPETSDILMVNTCGFIESAKEESVDAILDLVQVSRRSDPGQARGRRRLPWPALPGGTRRGDPRDRRHRRHVRVPEDARDPQRSDGGGARGAGGGAGARGGQYPPGVFGRFTPAPDPIPQRLPEDLRRAATTRAPSARFPASAVASVRSRRRWSCRKRKSWSPTEPARST